MASPSDQVQVVLLDTAKLAFEPLRLQLRRPIADSGNDVGVRRWFDTLFHRVTVVEFLRASSTMFGQSVPSAVIHLSVHGDGDKLRGSLSGERWT
jgi:hypothetical protein